MISHVLRIAAILFRYQYLGLKLDGPSCEGPTALSRAPFSLDISSAAICAEQDGEAT